MSLPGAHLSRVVTTDFIQLVPDRTARVTVDGGNAIVTVTGWSGRNIVAEKEVVFPWISPDLQPEPPAGPNTRVRVALEVNNGGGDDLAWRRVGQEVTLGASATGFHVIWSGEVPLPADAVGSGRHRLLVTETEEYVPITGRRRPPT